MRDVLIILIVAAGAFVAIKRPWIGVMLWTWLSIMNPHRFAWGIAVDAPLAAVAAIATLIGLLLTRDRESPFKGGAVVALVLFMVWVTLSWVMGLDPVGDYEQWNKVMKIDLMILVALALLHTKQHIFAFAWVAIGSLGLLGVKGGVFTALNGGGFRVFGPPGSFIEDNNAFALAVVMVIPLLRFLQLQLQGFWSRHAITLAMLLCAASAVGSYSRGGLIAIASMALLLWWRSKAKFVGAFVLVGIAMGLVAFMPEAWMGRMETITNYEQDTSAMGRIGAWWTAWGIAFDYPFGVGFDPVRQALFNLYSPFPAEARAAHSNYFQVLGNHGFVGLAIYVSIWIATWRSAGWLRANAAKIPEAEWGADLGAMCQVSLIGYLSGGMFLSLAYFDMPYNVMVLVLLTRVWVQTRGWEREPVHERGWRTIPGLGFVPVLARKANRR